MAAMIQFALGPGGRARKMSLVLDASIALAWSYADENTDAILRVFEIVKSESASVPALWRWEIANALETNAKRGRHGSDFSYAALALFPIRVDVECVENAWLGTVTLAERNGLTVYDPAYLELAVRRRIPLSTLGREMRAAAESEECRCLKVERAPSLAEEADNGPSRQGAWSYVPPTTTAAEGDVITLVPLVY